MADAGFVFSLALDGRGGAVETGSGAADSLSWKHFDYSLGDVQSLLLGEGVDHQVAESLVRNDTRPRTVVTDAGVLVVLRGVNLNPGAEPEDMVSLRMWVQPDRLITVRQRRLLSVQDVRTALLEGNGPRDVAELVIALVERVADRIADFVDAIETSATHFEDAIESARTLDVRSDVAALRRQIAVVRRFLAPQRDALDNLYRQSKGLLNEDQAYSIREQSDRITRYVEDLDLVRERALVIQEELLNRIAHQQNDRMYVLSVVAAIFLPITFITGLFGMNVAGLPGTEQAAAFWFVCGAMLLLSVVVVVLFKTRNWF